jgi:hypothetical protein
VCSKFFSYQIHHSFYLSSCKSTEYHCQQKSDRMSADSEETINRVKSSGKDYYAVLGVDKDANEAAIKKAYRKLALQLHPDKCKLDGAEEAFKSVSAAYNCLSNESSRRTYDMTGGESTVGSGGGGHPFEGVDPNEIFEQFFRQNGGFQGFQGMPGGGQTFFFSTGGPGVSFSTMGGNPFFNMSSMNRRRAGGSDPDARDDLPQQPPSIDQLLPDYLKVLIPVFSVISKVIPVQFLVIAGVFLAILVFRFLIQIVFSRLFYVIGIFTIAPQRFKWRLFLVLVALHTFGFLP